jgi:hypothetical protein
MEESICFMGPGRATATTGLCFVCQFKRKRVANKVDFVALESLFLCCLTGSNQAVTFVFLSKKK